MIQAYTKIITMASDPKIPDTEATEWEYPHYHLPEDDEENDYGDFMFIPDMGEAVDWDD